MDNDQNQLDLIRKDLERYGDIDAIAHSKGGGVLIDALSKDVMATLYRLTTGYKTLSHTEMIALCAGAGANLDLLHTLTRSEKNKEMAKERLQEAVME